MIDETSARKEHLYVVLDTESHDVLLMAEQLSAQAFAEFVAAIPTHTAKAEAIMDMSPGLYYRLLSLPYHEAGRCVVRMSLRKQGADLTGGLSAPRGNEWMRLKEQLHLRRKLARSWGGRSRCASPSKGSWPMATCLPSAGGWAGPTAPGSNPFAKTPEPLTSTSNGHRGVPLRNKQHSSNDIKD